MIAQRHNARRRAQRLVLRAARADALAVELRAARAEVELLRRRLALVERRLERNTRSRRRLASALDQARRQADLWKHRAIPAPIKGCRCVRCQAARVDRDTSPR